MNIQNIMKISEWLEAIESFHVDGLKIITVQIHDKYMWVVYNMYQNTNTVRCFRSDEDPKEFVLFLGMQAYMMELLKFFDHNINLKHKRLAKHESKSNLGNFWILYQRINIPLKYVTLAGDLMHDFDVYDDEVGRVSKRLHEREEWMYGKP